MFILVVDVDDIILAGKSSERIQQIIKEIAPKFKAKDTETYVIFWELKVRLWQEGGIWIGQPTYIKVILKKFNMENSKSVGTTVEAGAKLIKTTDDDELFDPETYQ